MNDMSNSPIEAAYRARTPASAALALEAQTLFPSGITHDARHLKPYGIYVERGQGPHKWDADGNEYIDYFGGHGAMLLGHAREEVVTAVQEAIAHGSQFGASTEKEVRWTQIIKTMVPAAERVRFTASGTEATLMALRLCRAFTGKRKLVRFQANFHGWHDHMTSGWISHFDGSPAVGVPPSVADNVRLLPPGDIEAVREVLASDRDLAAVILEPTGASFGMVPVTPGFVAELREVTAHFEVPLIFDEVVTGFRVSPGGAQARLGVTPDLSVHAKILAGGLPGGAVVGRKEVLDYLDFDATAARGVEKVAHPGTFNGNPISASAGIAALEIVAASGACDIANECGQSLREKLNGVLAEERVPWAAYGEYSGFHIFTNPEGRDVDPLTFDPFEIPFMELKSNPPEAVRKLRLALLANGVDIGGWPGGFLSATHTKDDIECTGDAFREALKMLRAEGEI